MNEIFMASETGATTFQVYLAGGIFLLTYAIIVSEKIHRTIAALAGGFLMILLGIVTQEQAFHHSVDWNVIFLLAGMMMIANVLSETGLFQWIAIQAVKLGRRDPFRILVLLSLVTAVTSAALDNVTVVVLIAPVTLFVANNLGITPIPFLIAEVLASNIGGAATLIGDPPNILIGSAAKIDFITFAANMTPPVIVVLILFIPLSYFVFRKDLVIKEGGRPHVMALEDLITDPVLLRKCLIVIAGVLIGFTLHGFLHLEPATIAMAGATILLLWSRKDPHHILQNVEWTTLFFFVGLFITVESIVEVGIIEAVAQKALEITGGNLPLTTLFILWLSAVASGIVDNIPYTATMIPLVKSLGAGGMHIEPLWWALALGADMGGNFTLVGASANVVVASLAERSGYKISFMLFFRYSVLITLISILVSSGYLWLRYFM
jgi:Na+/H+ antiporter NhaD/arsenite permease-like protein